jgi:hypothetical protein
LLADMGSPIPSVAGPISGALREDEFYDAAISQSVDWRGAAAFIARSLASEFYQMAESTTIPGEISVSFAKRADGFAKLAAGWEKALADETAAAGTGGTFITIAPSRPPREYDGEFRPPDDRRFTQYS